MAVQAKGNGDDYPKMIIIRKIILPLLVFVFITGVFVLCTNTVQKKINRINVIRTGVSGVSGGSPCSIQACLRLA